MTAAEEAQGPVAAEGRAATATLAPAARAGGALPPANAPLKANFAALQARADAGDLAAATRLYRDLDRCRGFARREREVRRYSDELIAARADTTDARQRDSLRAGLEAAEGNERSLDALRAQCAGLDDSQLGALAPNLQKAALLGEPYARACYLARGPGVDAAGLLDHPERLSAYRGNARAMIERGIADGDWRVLDQLRGAYEPGADSLLAAAVGKDPSQRYRYLKLFRLGAPPRPGVGDEDLAMAAAPLSPSQLADADAWATRTFNQNFHGRALDADGPLWDPCVFPSP
ncbi:hypothetical protein J5226_01150 [Lysobacter sp. K5869]|uniref:hypothetical protein n=1 Tax=Lysobacter sp. K5869 TaxID=2820808 RepID=UPI001C062518|nr:hypothetical protein [Lysobacter sp. K5869]QWP77043.1 hypothetical protein J5226_01150 [Lysobacter sp. K5869]